MNAELFCHVIDIDIDSNIDVEYYTNNTFFNVSMNLTNSANLKSADINASCHVDWDESLIGYWNFEHLNQESVFDNSTKNNDLRFYYQNYVSNITGKYGNGSFCNGSINPILLNNSEYHTNEITIEAWIKENITSFNLTLPDEDILSEDEWAYSVIETSDNCYVMVGQTNSTNTTGDVLLAKTDFYGNLLWLKTWGNNSVEDYGRDVIETTNDSYLVLAKTTDQQGTIGKGQTGDDDYDIWLLEVDYNGTILNNWMIGGDYDDEGYSVIQNATGHYVITGYTESYSDSPGKKDILVMFVNSTNGKKLYNLSYGDPDSTQWEAGTDIELTSNGNYIITGYEYVDATQKRDLSLIYINENDNSTEFHYTFGGTLRDLGRSVKETSDNRFVVTGYSNNTDSNYYDGNLSLFIFDDTGSRLWENSLLYGGNNWTSGLSIDTTNDGGYIITGHTNYSETKYDYDLLLIKTNSQGSIDWTRRYDLGNYDTGWSVSQTSDGGFIIAGYNNLTSLNYSAWLLKTDEYGNFTYCINNQSLTKKIIELDPNNLTGLYLENGTIIGKINGDEVNYSQESLSNLSNYWHHIALTFNGSIIKFYINGSLVNTFENDTILNNKNLTTRIGQYFCGIIDEVKIWNRTLTNEEINSSYNCLLTGNYLNRNFTGLTERAYSYYYHAILANGSENSPTTRFVTVDQTAPSSSVNTISVFNQTGQEIALTVSATETLSGLNQTKIKWYNSTNNFNWNGPWYNNSFCVNNTPWIMSNSIFFSFNFTNANGTGYYRFYSIAKDNASNWEISPIQNDTQCYANTSNNFAPYASSTPSPSNGSTGISITADLSWRNNSDPDDTTNSETNLTYDIYFGTNSTPNAGDLKSRNQTTMTYDTGTLTNSITYYWMIITYDNHSIGTPSPIWSFTTVAAGDDDDDTQGPGDYTPPSDNEDDTNESADETTNQTNTTTDVSTVGNDGINETTPSINQTVEEIINLQNVTRNSTVEINFTKEEDLGLVNIKINPKINFTDFKISVRLKNDTDADLIKIEDTNFSIYKYLEINLSSNNSYIESKDINSSEIRFKVKKSWIENENINFSTISLMRLNNSTWVKLNTIWQNENQNETYYYFIAETPGFSTFAVVGSKVIETGEPSQYREPEIPWLIIFGFIISAIIILIVILVKAKYIYIEEEPIKEEKQKEE